MKIGNAKGMTYVEILIATLLFILAIVSLLNSLTAIVYFISLSGEQTLAISDLRNMMEQIKVTAFANMVGLFPNSVIDGPTGNYYQAVVGGYTLNNEHIVVTYRNTNTDPLEIRLSLTWQDRRNHNQNLAISTFKTR